MTIVAIDVGNTRGRVGAVSEQVVEPGLSVDTSVPSQAIPELFDWSRRRVEEDPSVEAVAFCSVVEAASQLWVHLAHGHRGSRAVPWCIVDHRSSLPFRVDVEQPETVGADRYANVAGAVGRGLPSAIVVDLGTANTFDLLLEGHFRGGLIAPGCAESHRRLIERGSRLPDIPFVHSAGMVGRNTREAIETGSFRQALSGVAGVIDALREEFGDLPVLLTGGMAELLGPELPGRPLYLPDLTLEGAAVIAGQRV